MKCINILLVEDNEGDIFLTREAIEESGVSANITSIRDGHKAISFFEGLIESLDAPDLVLLDINLPKVSGHEVLRYIKNHDRYCYIPVIMLTTSSAPKDILRCYQNQASCYITKSIEAADSINAVSKMADFWTNVASLPKIEKHRADGLEPGAW